MFKHLNFVNVFTLKSFIKVKYLKIIHRINRNILKIIKPISVNFLVGGVRDCTKYFFRI